MRRLMLLASAALVLVATGASPASAGWRVGVGIGIGFPICGPGYYAPYYPYYPYYYPPPVVVQPAPVVVQPAYPAPAVPAAPALAALRSPAAPAAPAGSAAPELIGAPVPRPAPADARQADIDRRIDHLSNPNARARADAAIELGRMKAEKAVDALVGALSRDTSPVVREASARALGLIGSPRALPTLQHAAQADDDRDVRNSARFAADVIQTNR